MNNRTKPQANSHQRRTRARRVRNSSEWLRYYQKNAAALLEIPWDRGAEITASELRGIGPSLQAWQLGESSDGSHLRKAAEAYAAHTGDTMFPAVADLFIKEEQRHGGMLGRFISLAGLPDKQRDWGDTAFRAIRYSSANMEVWATPVIMVETIALLYYRAIRDATRSPVLRTICNQILHDEIPHIRFQYERLAILHRERSRIARTLTHVGQRALFLAVVFAVWAGHHRAFRAGGFSFRRYWHAAWKRMGFAWKMMDPECYDWRRPFGAASHAAQRAMNEARSICS